MITRDREPVFLSSHSTNGAETNPQIEPFPPSPAAEFVFAVPNVATPDPVSSPAPATLNQLVQKAEAILAERTSDAQRELRDPSGKISNNSGDNPDSRILAILCNIARFALKPSHEAKARIRTLALDCLRAGVHSVDDESADGVFGLAAMGARDERWVVRAAAARVAGAVLRVDGRDLGGRGAGDRRLLSLISSKNVRHRLGGRAEVSFVGGKVWFDRAKCKFNRWCGRDSKRPSASNDCAAELCVLDSPACDRASGSGALRIFCCWLACGRAGSYRSFSALTLPSVRRVSRIIGLCERTSPLPCFVVGSDASLKCFTAQGWRVHS